MNFITLVWEGRCTFPLSYVDKTHQKDKIEAIFPHQDHISRCCFVAKLWLYGEVMTELYLPLVREQKLMNTTIYRVQEQVCELWARKPSLQFVPFHSTTFSSEDTTYHIREISFLARLLDPLPYCLTKIEYWGQRCIKRNIKDVKYGICYVPKQMTPFRSLSLARLRLGKNLDSAYYYKLPFIGYRFIYL